MAPISTSSINAIARAARQAPSLLLLAVLLSACGGDESDAGDDNAQAPSTGDDLTASEFLLGYAGGFLYDDGGLVRGLTSITDFDTIDSLSTAVTAARNASSFAVQRFSRWQDVFGTGTFPSNSNWSFAAINLEYARGAGLTGAGQSIAVFDNVAARGGGFSDGLAGMLQFGVGGFALLIEGVDAFLRLGATALDGRDGCGQILVFFGSGGDQRLLGGELLLQSCEPGGDRLGRCG